MNFEFIKGLRGLQYVYENCSNAEKLAISMPVQSVFTSRKSAELLAKFLYMAAHNEVLEGLTFVDILSDPMVGRLINNRKVMNAFHHIRKGGNKAVHGDEQESPDEAVSILHDLHFVTGETACILGLIDHYPRFERNIQSHPEAQYIDEKDTEEKARAMFLDYVEKYNAQSESENFYSKRVDSLLDEFNEFCSNIDFIPNLMHIDEILEFKAKPSIAKTIKPIQEHFAHYGMLGLRHLRGEQIDKRGFEYKAEITLYGEDGYTTSNLVEFVYALMYDLPKAVGFKIVSHYFGPNPLFDNNVHEPFENTISRIGEFESFSYSLHEYLFMDGENYYSKYENGEWIDLKKLYTPEIINLKSEEVWASNHLYLHINFDFEAHKDILEELRNLIRAYSSEDDLRVLEDFWEDDDDPGLIMAYFDWDDGAGFKDVRGFLDSIHGIIAPIMDECEGAASGDWFLNDDPFAVATWEWTNNGFRIIGTTY